MHSAVNRHFNVRHGPVFAWPPGSIRKFGSCSWNTRGRSRRLGTPGRQLRRTLRYGRSLNRFRFGVLGHSVCGPTRLTLRGRKPPIDGPGRVDLLVECIHIVAEFATHVVSLLSSAVPIPAGHAYRSFYSKESSDMEYDD